MARALNGINASPPASEDGHARRVRSTKERILDAAVEAFERDGYSPATIEAIAGAAGVAPASVYNHFASKAGVAQALAERALRVHDDYVAAAWALDSSPLERLIAAAGATLAFARERRTLFQAISLSYLSPLGLFPAKTSAARAIDARRQEQLGRIIANLDAAVAADELRPIDTLSMAHFVIASWAAVLTMYARPGSPADPAATLAAGIRAMIQGVATEATVTRDGRLRARYERALDRSGLTSPGA